MDAKKIRLDPAAYELLRSRKRAGESFSDVIRAHFAESKTGASLLGAARAAVLSAETLDELDRIVADRV